MSPFREKRKGVNKGCYPKYRGRLVHADGKRVKRVLFTDLDASKRELRRLQAEQDREAQDPESSRRRKFAAMPIASHVVSYIEHLRRTTKNAQHPKICASNLSTAIRLGGWQRLSDITQSSAESVLNRMVTKHGRATVGYQNTVLRTLKALLSWCCPERLPSNPLQKLRRGSTLRAEKRRQRRDATANEIQRLFTVLPASYVLKFAFALLTGFRRSEQRCVTLNDLRLNAPIPFIQLRDTWTKNGQCDCLPVHAFLIPLLRDLDQPGDAPIFDSIPDVKTLKRYYALAGVEFVTKEGRLDWHAFRHTFATMLYRFGASRATNKALLRHSATDTNDGYSHSRLAELNEVLQKLPVPIAPTPESAMLTGTNGGTNAGQENCVPLHSIAEQCTMRIGAGSSTDVANGSVNTSDCVDLHGSALRDLNLQLNSATVLKTGPDTQVD